MKNVNEKKQDLLLDALSCIDEDILERGLALRESGTVIASQYGSDEKANGTRLTNPALFDLSKPSNPPRRNPWRATAVAAACLLFCVIPLSFWLAAKHGFNLLPEKSDAMETPGAMLDGTCADTDMKEESVGDFLPDVENNAPNDGQPEPGAPQEPNDAETDGWEAPTASVDFEADTPEAPVEDVTEAETIYGNYDNFWTVISNTNQNAVYEANGANNGYVTLHATVLTQGSQPSDAPILAEDELALKLGGQWMLSICSLDYANHFPLFHETVVRDRFITQTAKEGIYYTQAMEILRDATAELFPLNSLTLELTLEENRLLSRGELDTYRQSLATVDLKADKVTAARAVTISGSFTLDGLFVSDYPLTFTCYEYDEVWYLDNSLLDDDLSIDLLESGLRGDTGFFESQATAGTVVAVDDTYLYLDTGNAFRIDGAAVQNQTDGGAWQDAVIRVGDTVTVTHYSLELEGLYCTVEGVENEKWTLSTATLVDFW